MGARRGEQVIQRLKEQPPEIWHRGIKVSDITTEPGFANGVRARTFSSTPVDSSL
jgi:4-hydroxyphenylacetate 3-monooxygenase